MVDAPNPRLQRTPLRAPLTGTMLALQGGAPSASTPWVVVLITSMYLPPFILASVQHEAFQVKASDIRKQVLRDAIGIARFHKAPVLYKHDGRSFEAATLPQNFKLVPITRS